MRLKCFLMSRRFCLHVKDIFLPNFQAFPITFYTLQYICADSNTSLSLCYTRFLVYYTINPHIVYKLCDILKGCPASVYELPRMYILYKYIIYR